MSSNATSGTISSLTFNNLTIGSWYEINSQLAFLLNFAGSDTSVSVDIMHDGNALDIVDMIVSGTGGAQAYAHPSLKFKATATTLTFDASGGSANAVVWGNGTENASWVQLSEVQPHIETTEW